MSSPKSRLTFRDRARVDPTDNVNAVQSTPMTVSDAALSRMSMGFRSARVMTSLIGLAALGACQQPGIATRHLMMCERDSHLVIIDRAAWPKFVESLAKSKPHNEQWFGKSNSDYLFIAENKEPFLGKYGIVRDDFVILPGLGQSPIARIINFSYI